MTDDMFLPEPNFDDGIIVDRPTLLGKWRTLTEWSSSFASWVLWFYALRPLLLTVLWLLGYSQFYEHMVRLGGARNWGIVVDGLYLIAGIFAAMLLWNRYNTVRYRYHYKGAGKGLATIDVIASYYRITPDAIRALQKSDRVDAYFEPHHRLRLRTPDMETVGYYNPQQQEVERVDILHDHVHRADIPEARMEARDSSAPRPTARNIRPPHSG